VSHSSALYSGSECEWEGGYEAVESAHVVSELADALLQALVEDTVLANMAIEAKKSTRRLVARAQQRPPASLHTGGLGGTATAAHWGADASPANRGEHSPGSPVDAAQAIKKARRQAIKL
jgi:hypothetical protein